MKRVEDKDMQQVIAKADQGDADALCDLGVMCYQGKLMPKNMTRALSLFLASAAQGNDKAQFNLAVIYENGFGVEQSHDEAIKYYRRSSLQGNVGAIKQLAIIREKAYRLAIGFGAARYSRKIITKKGLFYGGLKETHEGLTPKYLDHVGCQFFYGRTLKKDLGAAVDCFRESARLGSASAKYHLACVYALGGTQGDMAGALLWYTKAADQGHAQSQYILGKMVFCGDRVPKDIKKAVTLLESSATQGNTQAQMWLAKMHLNGRSMPSDEAAALRWLKLADKGGDQDAPYELAFHQHLKHCR